MNLAFRQFDALRILASDEYLVRIAAGSFGGAVPRHLSEGREVDSRVSCRFNQLDIFTRSTTDDRMQSALEVKPVYLSSQLHFTSALSLVGLCGQFAPICQ